MIRLHSQMELASEFVATPVSIRIDRGGLEILQRLEKDWRQLCDEINNVEPFYQPEWVQAYVRAFAPQCQLVVITAWMGGKLRAVLPLRFEIGRLSLIPVRKLIGAVNVHCCRFDLLCCRGSEGVKILRKILEAVKELPGWDVLDLPYVIERSNIEQLIDFANQKGFNVASFRSQQSLYLSLTECECDNVVATNGRKFRANLRRSLRQLEKHGEIRTHHFNRADPKALETFYELECSGWKGRKGTAIACNHQTRQFYDHIAQAAEKNDYFALDILTVGGKPISANLGFNLRGHYRLAKAAYNEDFRRYGPGHLLLKKTLEKSKKLGLKELDFVGPATWDESRWASYRRTSFQYYVFRKNMNGSLAYFFRVSLRSAIKSIFRIKNDCGLPFDLKGRPDSWRKIKKWSKIRRSDETESLRSRIINRYFSASN